MKPKLMLTLPVSVCQQKQNGKKQLAGTQQLDVAASIRGEKRHQMPSSVTMTT